MRTWGILLIVAGVLLLASLGVFAWAASFYAVGIGGPGLVVLPVAGVASLLTGSVMVLRVRSAPLGQSDSDS